MEIEFQSDPIDETAYEGDTVELRCDAPRGEPTPTVSSLSLLASIIIVLNLSFNLKFRSIGLKITTASIQQVTHHDTKSQMTIVYL